MEEEWYEQFDNELDASRFLCPNLTLTSSNPTQRDIKYKKLLIRQGQRFFLENLWPGGKTFGDVVRNF